MRARVDLQDAMYQRLAEDVELAALTEGGPSDKRVYQAYGLKERIVTDALPAYVSLWARTTQPPFLDRETVEFQVSAYAKSENLCKAVQDRIDALLHRTMTLTAPGWTIDSLRRTGERSAFEETEGVWQHDATYTMEAH